MVLFLESKEKVLKSETRKKRHNNVNMRKRHSREFLKVVLGVGCITSQSKVHIKNPIKHMLKTAPKKFALGMIQTNFVKSHP